MGFFVLLESKIPYYSTLNRIHKMEKNLVMKNYPFVDPKFCLFCNKQIKGRSDKKYCNDGCRSAYHNCKELNLTSYVKYINKELYKNRKILSDLFENTYTEKIFNVDHLIFRGYNFMFFTHQSKYDEYLINYFCYDYGYRFQDAIEIYILKEERF